MPSIKIGLTEITALVGATVGIAALVLGLVNYLRERPRILVKLRWDLTITNNPRCSSQKLWGLVLVANVGRRPIYISHVHLTLPKGHELAYLALTDGIRGTRLEEGAAPADFMIDQENLDQYSEHWRDMRAAVYDTAGKKYQSKRLSKKEKPSWALKS